ncbi:MAG: ASCH domain-containing protein [Vicinamibacterales bacterium]
MPQTSTRDRAISIRQPDVELILRGIKQREYRSRPTTIRGRVLLYASLRPADWPQAWRKVGKKPGALPAGMIVGSVEITDCRWDDRVGHYAYVLERPRRLRPPLLAINQPQPCFWRPRFRR